MNGCSDVVVVGVMFLAFGVDAERRTMEMIVFTNAFVTTAD